MTRDQRASGDSVQRSSQSSVAGGVRQSGRKSRASAFNSKAHGKGEAAGPVVIDPDDGCTMRTPKPLLLSSVQVPAKHLNSLFAIEEGPGHAMASEPEPTLQVFPSFGSISNVGTATPGASETGEEEVPQGNADDAAADMVEPTSSSWPRDPFAPVDKVAKSAVKQLDLDRIVTVSLQETCTHVLLKKAACADSNLGRKVLSEVKKYDQLLKTKLGNDKFVTVGVQTRDNGAVLRKLKEAQTNNAQHKDSFTQWETLLEEAQPAEAPKADMQRLPTSALLQDANCKVSHIPAGATEDAMDATMASRKFVTAVSEIPSNKMNSAIVDPASGGTIAAVHNSVGTSTDPEQVVDQLAAIPGLQEALNDLESMLMHNKHIDKMLLYKGMQPLEEMMCGWTLRTCATAAAPVHSSEQGSHESVEADSVLGALPAAGNAVPNAAASPALDNTAACGQDGTTMGSCSNSSHMQLLWQWKCDITEGRSVTSMSWCTDRPDLVAAGYGSFVFGENKNGLVCIWSLKNPNYPLWSFSTEAGVTALDFSTVSGGVLAVGLYSGHIAVYDVKSRNSEPSITSYGVPGKHHDPVWKLKWTDTGNVASTLVSISTDGRVTRWKIAKGLEHNDLMKLKSVPRRDAPINSQRMANIARNLKQEAFISRLTAGTAFDFSQHDERIYLAATEDGWIHKCSTSYSEQYMSSYKDHMGPVYNVQWCPFNNSLFISASADWTCRLWQVDRPNALLTFQTGNFEVNDVQWCPNNSTVFATATSGGYVEVWDMLQGTLRPIASCCAADVKMTSVLFHSHNETMIAGDASGGISVFRLFGINRRHDSDEMQQRRLLNAMDANVMKTRAAQASSMS